jgi:hypothetical protein
VFFNTCDKATAVFFYIKATAGFDPTTHKLQSPEQGCQMVSFQTKNSNLGKFGRALHRLENVDIFYIFYSHLEYFTDIWDIL